MARSTDLAMVPGLTVGHNMARIAASNTAALGMGHSMATSKAADRIATVRGMTTVMDQAAPGRAAQGATEREMAASAGWPHARHGFARTCTQPSQHIFKSGTYARQTAELY